VSSEREAGTAVEARGLPASMVPAGLLVGIVAISSSPVLVRLGHLPAFARILALPRRCAADRAVRLVAAPPPAAAGAA
jgi:hypothetical protein